MNGAASANQPISGRRAGGEADLVRFLDLPSCFCDVVYDVGCNESRVLRIDT